MEIDIVELLFEGKYRYLIDYFKECEHYQKSSTYIVPLARQQIANLTGLRVETVIRAIKKMEKENLLRLEGRHIMY